MQKATGTVKLAHRRRQRRHRTRQITTNPTSKIQSSADAVVAGSR
jgi:hypothetical protein